MKIKVLNTAQGLIALYDEDYDEKRKLKIGQTYVCEIKKTRNLQFHKKYFALINCAWEYQSERRRAFFSENKDIFRKTVEIAAGWSERVYSISRKEWLEVPKSISFEKMDNIEFTELYERVKTVLFNTFLRDINKEEFLKNLINF
jgi:Protein of unknown function (DUF1367).